MNTLFLVYLIVEAIFGIGFLFFPSLMMAPMGVTVDVTSASFARMLGSMMISITVLFIFARRSEYPAFKRGVIYCAIVYLLISTVVLVINQVNGVLNSVGWSTVILHLIFLIWFGYYALKKNTLAEQVN